MAIRKVLIDGDEILRKVSKPVDNINDRVITLLDDMRDTLLDSGGVGLAAVQVGYLKRIYLVDVTPWDEEDSRKNRRPRKPQILEFINNK
jgi:peptide deformylase